MAFDRLRCSSDYGDAMKRRSRAGGEATKGRRRKTPEPKRRNVPKDTPASNGPNREHVPEVRRLTRELSEAREQQAATSEVLKAISGSTFDLRTVLDTLLQSAVKLCSADQGTVAQRKDDTFYRSVSYGFSPAYLDYIKDIPVEPGRDTGTGRALLEGKVIHIPDVLADPDFTWKEGQRLGGFRTVLGVPMLREGVAVGVLALTRSRCSALHRRADRIGGELRGPSRHRYRERSFTQQTARGIGATNGNVGGAARYQFIVWRFRGSVPDNAGECHAHL